jgi:hypothetical protein
MKCNALDIHTEFNYEINDDKLPRSERDQPSSMREFPRHFIFVKIRQAEHLDMRF